MKFFGILLTLVIVLGYAPVSSAKVYIWTDKNGVKHYSNVAPAEAAEEVKNDDEIKSDPSTTEKPRNAIEGERQKPDVPAAETGAGEGIEPTDGKKIAPDKKSAEQDMPSQPKGAANMAPLNQDERIKMEKAHVKQLQIELAKDDSKRTEFIAKEEIRLLRQIEQLQRAPVSQFGSQKNKTRQVGYYRYRLETLVNSPETYFSYGDSDTN